MNISQASDLGLTPEAAGYRMGQNDGRKYIRMDMMLYFLSWSKANPNGTSVQFVRDYTNKLEDDIAEVL